MFVVCIYSFLAEPLVRTRFSAVEHVTQANCSNIVDFDDWQTIFSTRNTIISLDSWFLSISGVE